MTNQINYEAEVRKIYPSKSEIECSFYYNRKAKENLWHVEVIDLSKNNFRCIGKALFKNNAWQFAYNTLKKEGKL